MIIGEAVPLPRHFKRGERFEIRSEDNPAENVTLRVIVDVLSETTIKEMYDRSDTIEQVVDELAHRGLVIEEYQEVIYL